ncbi:protein-L-isoaspartate(D-aspartate) O-methyltransferase [Robbsia sp. Bb-Pol-6]|uniref:Protein-L-isoaspartate O-methyltransferase n=1 Tax=Robbsia betulipollinis TaxID=2981849 RepID=A0ABT3ZNH4_9BURK|nr:protein-L-isoaspartate(D-aspartate) O-methyltransferase [Robbsia betulipollinis]MCY0388094.1 protein-L-isoaspartate(D-aspartate) O-methyltransferase [Robbsia betulipollinis]
MSAGPVKRFPLTLSDLEKDPALPRQAGGAGRGGAKVAGTAPLGRGPVSVRAAPAGTSATAGAAPGYGAPRAAPARPILGAHLTLTSDRVRERMVERVRAAGVRNERVLAALRAVPRHGFVDAALAPQAYEEAALPIGHRQTISKPGVVAKMIEIALNGRASLRRVLEVGTGCGYQAAVLGRVAEEVFSIERIKPLHERAKRNLRPLRAPNIRLHYGDGRLGLPASAPFDAIIVAAAGLDIPPALAEQLAIGGRLIAPVGGDSQVLTLVERISAHQWRETVLDRVFFVPLKSGVI